MVTSKIKMAMAPFLAITLALLLAGAINYLPIYPQTTEKPLASPTQPLATSKTTPEATPSPTGLFTSQSEPSLEGTPNTNPPSIPTPAATPSPAVPRPTEAPTPMPTTTPLPATPIPSTAPTPSPAIAVPTGASNVPPNVVPILFIIATIAVAVVAVYVLFSEKELNKED